MKKDDNDFIFKIFEDERKEEDKKEDSYRNFELYSFLEDELERLEKKSILLSETSNLLTKNSQSELIIEKLANHVSDQYEELITLLSNTEHNFWRNSAQNFNRFYSEFQTKHN